MQNQRLVLMDTGLFFEGMHVRAEIYYCYKDNYVLFCKDVVFDTELIEKLKRVGRDNGGIYIDEQYYEETWNESLKCYSMDVDTYEKSFQRVKRQYDKVLSKTFSFLGEISPSNRIPLELADEITDSIADDLNQFDRTMIIKCINQISQADNYLYTHSVDVAALNGIIGQWMNLSDYENKQLIKVGLMHDLGKLKVPPQILHKAGRLTPEEFAIIKSHPIQSYNMLRESGEMRPEILLPVRQHHEKPNGSGYPDGLSQKDILLASRITAVSDIYDAMVSKRCYKEASTPFEILSMFKINQFSGLDHQVVNTFLDNMIFFLIGINVKLSNGEEGEVIFIPPGDLAHPIVKVRNHIVTTSETCRCVSAGDCMCPQM